VTTLEGGNGDCDPTFQASCSSFEHHLLTQEDFNDLVCDLNLSKKKPNSWVGDQKHGIFSTKTTKYVTFTIAKMKSKNFSLKKTTWYFVMKFSSVTKAPEHQHDPSE
jgi:hypothetical protein